MATFTSNISDYGKGSGQNQSFASFSSAVSSFEALQELRNQYYSDLLNKEERISKKSYDYKASLEKQLYDEKTKKLDDLYDFQVKNDARLFKLEKEQEELLSEFEKENDEKKKSRIYDLLKEKSKEISAEEELAKKRYDLYVDTQKKIDELNDKNYKIKNANDKIEQAKKLEDEKKRLLEQSEYVLSLSKKQREEMGISSDEYKEAKSYVKDYKYNNGFSQGLSNFKEGLENSLKSLLDFTSKLNTQIDEIAAYQKSWDARLQGSGYKFEGSDGLSSKVTGAIGVSPLVQVSDVMKNIDKLVDKGISYNVEQRAFLETVKDGIATTFEAANGTLLQLVRIQQADTTAARLGLEANLTEYFNGMYKTTEYLTDAFDTISGNIYEATSQLTGEVGVAFEYQVQKWLGSLYSVGASQDTVSNIASAIGMLGSGNVSGLASNSAMQNLLVMASGNAGLDYSSILSNGLDSNTTNKLLASIVDYLGDIYEENKDNKVVLSQYSSIFGVSVSDLKAAANLSNSVVDISKSSLDYAGSMSELLGQMNQLYTRTSTGELLENVWNNIEYNLSSNIASSPAIYAIWKVSQGLDALGGINIPTVSALGTFVDLNTTVSDIMKVGALSGGLLGAIGDLVSGISSGGNLGFTGQGMMNALGISTTGISTLTRGTGLGSRSSGASVSQSAVYVGNSSSSDVYESTMTGINDTKAGALAEAQEENTGADLDTIDSHLTNIYTLLEAVVNGSSSFHTIVEDYGLTIN